MLVIIVSLVWVAIIILIKVGDKDKGKDDKSKDSNKGKDSGDDGPPDDDDEPPDYDDEVSLLL